MRINMSITTINNTRVAGTRGPLLSKFIEGNIIPTRFCSVRLNGARVVARPLLLLCTVLLYIIRDDVSVRGNFFKQRAGIEKADYSRIMVAERALHHVNDI